MALAHTILATGYCMQQREKDYADLGPDYFTRRDPEARARYLVKQLHSLGYKVQLDKTAA